MDISRYEVPVEKLSWKCDPGLFDFECTQNLAPLKEFVGQERATRAIEFGLNMKNSGYNIYVAGITGTGKTSMVQSYIERVIAEKTEQGETFDLEDWCYIYNFRETDSPVIASLPQGKGKAFRNEMDSLLTRVRHELEQAFASEEYKAERQKVVEAVQVEQQKIFEELSGEARQQGFVLQMTQAGPALYPMIEDRPMKQEEYIALEEGTKNELNARQTELRKKVTNSMETVSGLQNESMERLQELDKQIGDYAVSRLIRPLETTYEDRPKIRDFLEGLKKYIEDNLDLFKTAEEPQNQQVMMQMNPVMAGRDPFLPFKVNVFVDNSETKGPPVIVESNPNFRNVFGNIERRFLFGGYLSDHTMLKPGSLNKASGGYLLVNATDILTNPGVWPALKRAIKNREARIEDPVEQFGLVAPQGLKPEPMPIKIKVIITGDPGVYQMLSMYDEDFWEIFKVKADFDSEIENNKENILSYAAFLSGCCDECESKHFDPSGVAKLIEYSCRMVADQEKLSSRFAQVKEWIEEADYWATREKARYITASHVQKAIDERLFRHNLTDEKMKDMIERGTIMIDTEGEEVGQVNALSVYSLGDITFGKPSRITAKTFLGRGGIVNIEREAQLSGPTHNKGVLILSGYLGWKYAQDKPLSLSASICFEQSYSGVDGDSASSTELYAILSSISGIPLKQTMAVTGSVNQAGEIQPIGGVNQKIEGFFQVCQSKGLTGDQGVLVPEKNLKNLMLQDEVTDAVKEGKFHIYSARTIDEGIEILTGIPAGEKQEDGTYPEGTVNYMVDKKLKEMADKLKGFNSQKDQEEEKELEKQESSKEEPKGK
ncbi:MAG: AAA family ATPase [Dehalococcoidales bacterium]|nr:AAA family ATPase [Dehalococcoidales bacterium]